MSCNVLRHSQSHSQAETEHYIILRQKVKSRGWSHFNLIEWNVVLLSRIPLIYSHTDGELILSPFSSFKASSSYLRRHFYFTFLFTLSTKWKNLYFKTAPDWFKFRQLIDPSLLIREICRAQKSRPVNPFSPKLLK